MKTNYDDEELDIISSYDAGTLIQTENHITDIEMAVRTAKNTLNKSKHISIRLSEKDLNKLKAKSLESGIAYQTLIGVLIHQYAENKIKIEI